MDFDLSKFDYSDKEFTFEVFRLDYVPMERIFRNQNLFIINKQEFLEFNFKFCSIFNSIIENKKSEQDYKSNIDNLFIFLYFYSDKFVTEVSFWKDEIFIYFDSVFDSLILIDMKDLNLIVHSFDIFFCCKFKQKYHNENLLFT